MSDTPRTDAEFEYVKYGSVDFKSHSEEIAAFARQLERELNAANERIKRLEESIGEAYAEMRKQLPAVTAVFDRSVWEKAKKAKP